MFVAGDATSLLNLQSGQMIGKTFAELVHFGCLPFDDASKVVAALDERSVWEGELTPRDSSQVRRTVKIVVNELTDDNGKKLGVRGILTDTTVATELSRKLKYQASHDSLTGLINRAEFERALEKALLSQRRSTDKAYVFVLDLDRFKVVNDNCGHLAGDDLLKQLSDLIVRNVRSADLVSSIGGDEFAVLLNNCSIASGIEVVEKIRRAIGRFRISWQSETYDVGVSIGVVQIDEKFAESDDILCAADATCFQAKRHRPAPFCRPPRDMD